MHTRAPRGYSLIGILITMAIIVVLYAISMQALDKAISGEGNTESGTAYSMVDKITLQQIYQSLLMETQSRNGALPTPSVIAGNADTGLNTTANLYSAMIAENYVTPKMLISANEQSPYIWPDDDYDYTSYAPARGTFWDPNFSADLSDDANVSFAHEPIFGKRRDQWNRPSFNSTFPMFGNRGPKGGIEDPSSYTYGKDGTWAGHAVFGDGHVEFFETFTPGSVAYYRNGTPQPDNIFAFDDGESGSDAILTFTEFIHGSEIRIQHD